MEATRCLRNSNTRKLSEIIGLNVNEDTGGKTMAKEIVIKTYRHKKTIFLAAILEKEIDSREPLKKELVKVKNRIAKALGTDKIMLQTV